MIDMMLILKIAGIGLILWAIEEVLSQAGIKSAPKYISIVGTVVILLIVIQQIVLFFETIQTMFTF